MKPFTVKHKSSLKTFVCIAQDTGMLLLANLSDKPHEIIRTTWQDLCDNWYYVSVYES